MIRFLQFSVLLAALAGNAAVQADEPREPKPRFKAVELYSWKVEGKWTYALLSGTNRLKSEAEVKAPKNQIKGVKNLKKALARLAVSESVFWFHRIKGFQYPDVATRKDLVRYAKTVKVKLSVPLKP